MAAKIDARHQLSQMVKAAQYKVDTGKAEVVDLLWIRVSAYIDLLELRCADMTRRLEMEISRNLTLHEKSLYVLEEITKEMADGNK